MENEVLWIWVLCVLTAVGFVLTAYGLYGLAVERRQFIEARSSMAVAIGKPRTALVLKDAACARLLNTLLLGGRTPAEAATIVVEFARSKGVMR